MELKTIVIRGARTHNLKNIDLDLPRNKLICITGLSGSGKSSLAFDTIFAEGQRRYVESLSTYARQFLSVMEKPDIDHIEGLSPAISIEQKTTSHNPRSTVGTVTEIYDYLRLLFARVGTPKCPEHKHSLEAQTITQMVDHIAELKESERYMMLAPVIKDRKGEHAKLLAELTSKGFLRVRLDGMVYPLDELPIINGKLKHTIEVVVDRFKIRQDLKQRIAESLETTLLLSEGTATLVSLDDDTVEPITFSEKYACPACGYALPELEPRMFSFNSPHGACQTCDGLGIDQYFDPDKVIVNSELSLSGGAIRGWDRRNGYYYQMICSIADHYKFDLKLPFNQLDSKIQNIVLNGSGTQKITFVYMNDRGDKSKRTHVFEGIIPNLKRRYVETESSNVRDELSKYISHRSCLDCEGSRLNEYARNVFITGHTLAQITAFPIKECIAFFKNIKLEGQKAEIAAKVFQEIRLRLTFLDNVGLDYLSLNRSANTLSGGEGQRIRLASQIGAGLVGVMYVLDEPSIGLHQRDNDKLLTTLTNLRDMGNTVIVVEHDEDAVLASDYVVDIGPGAGIHGGHIVAQGTPDDIKNNPDSITGQYLAGIQSIEIPKQVRKPKNGYIEIIGATENNLKAVDVKIPKGLMTCVTGVSGSGKSTLINSVFYKNAKRFLRKEKFNNVQVQKINGLKTIDKIIDIDQSPIGRTPRSNPATYTGLFTHIRDLFAGTEEARTRGYKPGRFSFNVKGGRCEACQGDGLVKVSMHFLPDVYVPCDVCDAKRYNRETLDVLFKGKNINEVLDMTVETAYDFFENIPVINRKLQTLLDVGLSYITLGQNATTLSGGEAQRAKLSRELSKRDTGNTLYILDEPTTGLHFADIKQLLQVLHKLRDAGNTIIIIEHNLDVVKTADWLIDLGPEGGDQGGQILYSGPTKGLTEVENSYTGQYLKKYYE